METPVTEIKPLKLHLIRKTIIVRRLLSSSPFLPYLISFFAWSNSNSDVNMQLVYTLEFFELFFNSLVHFATQGLGSE